VVFNNLIPRRQVYAPLRLLAEEKKLAPLMKKILLTLAILMLISHWKKNPLQKILLEY